MKTTKPGANLKLKACVLESMAEPLLVLNKSGLIQYANPAANAAAGYDAAELIGQPAFRFTTLPPDRQTEELHRIIPRVEAGEMAQAEYEIRRKDGTVLQVETQTSGMEHAGKLSLIMVWRDISGRKQNEQRLADALDLNGKMLAAPAIGILAYKASGQCVFANEALARMAGGTVPRILEGNFRRNADWRQSGLLQVAEQTLADGQPRSGEFYGSTRFGKNLWVQAHLASFTSGDELHLLAMAFDITERKRVESWLRLQRDLSFKLSATSDLQTALDFLLDTAIQIEGIDNGGAYLLSPGGDLNLVAYRGVTSEFAAAASRIPSDSPQAAIIKAGQPVFASFAELPLPPDEIIRQEGLRTTAVLPLSFEGRVLGALTLASHHHERIPPQSQVMLETLAAQAAGAIARIQAENRRLRLERQLLEISDREQARVGQEIHDGLCQELVSLAFDANSLERELSAKHRKEAHTARRLVDYLDQAITEARQLSRGLFPIRIDTDGLPATLETLAQGTRERFQIQCQFEAQGDLQLSDPAVAVHLFRIAQEAIHNAIKHSLAQRISVRLHTSAEETILTVEDDGKGIPAPDAEPLSSPWASASNGRTAGMGLHIMDYRARSIGGALRISPGAVSGTVVSCRIPNQQHGWFDASYVETLNRSSWAI